MTLTDRRIGLLLVVFLGLLVAAGLRAGFLGVVKADALKQAANGQQVEQVTVPARRGTILDRNGVELAVSEPAADVAATPYLIEEPVRAARRLAPLLGQSEARVLRKLARRDTGFVYLARQLPADRAERIERLELPGLELIRTTRRSYPRTWLASQVLGAVGVDGKGLSGLEYADDELLRGEDGRRRLTKDALDQPIAVREESPARPGRTLRLTLDAAIQAKAEAVLGEVGEEYRPRGATAIVMDPRDGRVLALANWPRVDANDPGGAPPAARRNRAAGLAYEPGSTFKAFTVAGALEDGTVEPGTSFPLAPQIQVADRTIGESHPRGYETMTTTDILAKSSNVGAVTIGLKQGAKRFDHWVRRFGFGRVTGVDLPGEERGQVLPVDRYSGSSMGNLPIGQGISVTPMQIVSAYAAIANGGMLRPARVVDAVDGTRARTPSGRRVLSRTTARQVTRMMEGVFAPGGTASEVSIPGYQLAGKTGTANKVDPETGLYSEEDYVASFVGFAPARDPQLLTAVVVDEPQGEIFGGVIAAPAFGRIMAFTLPYLEIPPH